MSNPLIEKKKDIQLHQVTIVPVEWLTPAEYNPRTIDEDQLNALKQSLEKNPEFLKVRPPIVNITDGREGIVIGGNQRVEAAKQLGWDKVPVMFVEAKDINQEKAWNLLDNKNAGKWNAEKLHSVVMDLHESGYDLTSFAHTPDEIANIMSDDFTMDDPTETDEYKEKGTTPGSKWVECPECTHQFKVSKDTKIQPPEDQ